MENVSNNEDILQDSVRAVFNCGTNFSEAKTISITDEFNPQQTLSTQRINFRHIYENKLPNEIGRSLAHAPEYDETNRQLLVGHFKELALEDLIEQQDYQNRYIQEDPELDQDNEISNEQESSNEYSSPRPPEPRPW
ncbi:hypothetical protein [Acinetobacter sp. YH01009]|uniref:hypothetical protein n=1 Tax=Acinetobacter TaxID=469 RepID=UPI0015D33B7B|nr:hypothetical protein [Acinetobacter sp. YH01009]